MSGEKHRILRSLNMAGTVNLEENTADGRKFVLKELAEESLPIYRRIAQLPPQENLMRVHEILHQDGHTAAVCGFAEGQPLDELLDGGRVFSKADILKITTQLCAAAEHLHRHGIIHRDIAPKNIILDENLKLTLIDFDIARLFCGNREQDTTLYGTEGFAPPEQYGFRETRFTADIYAVGVTLRLLINACTDCPPAQEVILRKIAAKCTRFVPEKRYRSAAAVRRALSRSRYIIPAVTAAASAVILAGIIAAILLLQDARGQQIPQTGQLTAAETNEVTPAAAETTAATSVYTASTAEQTLPSAAVTTPVPAASRYEPAETAATVPAATAVSTPVPAATSTTAATTTATAATTTAATTTAATTTAATTTAATTTAATTTAATPVPATAIAETTAVSEPQELHTSDMDNPNKITVTTAINERGYYEDYFQYEFYDDPAVHGEWRYCTSIYKENLTPKLRARDLKNKYFYGEHIYSAVSLGDNGEARCNLASGEEMIPPVCWTNGFLIEEQVEATTAQRMFVLTIDGEEFLFIENKTGDFVFRNETSIYEVYTRAQ